jgi:hypothetical protein
MHFDEPVHVKDNLPGSSDVPMIQMAKMHGTFHIHERVSGDILMIYFICSKKKLFKGSCSS